MKIVNCKLKIKHPTALLIAILVLILFLPAAIIITKNAKPAGAAWFNDLWGFRKGIPVTAHTSAETNVYLNLTGAAALDTSDTTKFQTDCGDLRFTDVRGRSLKYYLVSGCGTTTTVVHVLIPNFPAGAQTFYYYYGNPTVGNGAEPADFSTAASGVTIGTFDSEEKSPAPIAYWKFDEGYGASAFDAAGHGFTGALAGATTPSWQTEDQCVSGKCLYFNGSTASVTVANTVSAAQTISMWVRPTAVTSAALIDLNGAARVTVSSGTITATGFTSPTIYVNGTASSTLAANTWQHVVIVDTAGTSATAIKIGNYSTTYLNGFSDDVKIYNYARTAAQIKTDYNSRGAPKGAAALLGGDRMGSSKVGGLSQGLIGYWKMDETSGNAADSSGNALTLTNNGAITFAAGKFANSSSHNGTTQYFSTATTISGVQTVAFWVNPASTSDDYINLVASTTYINSTSGTISATGFTNPSVYVNGVLNGTLTASVWNHVAVTTNTAISASAFEAGRANGAYLNNTGKIDEVRLYNRALQPSEVATLYNFAPGPVGWWKMDENTGSTAADSSGNGYTGTWFGTGTHWGQGKIGQAGSFNGTDDYVKTSNLPQGVTEFTMEAWVKPDFSSTDNNDYAIIDWQLNSGVTDRIFLRWENNTSGFYADTNGNFAYSYKPTFSSGQWHHLAFTRGGTNTGQFYWDGIAVTTTKVVDVGGIDNTANMPVYIGDRIIDSAAKWDGLIDDVRVYNYARTANQIVEDMNAGHPAPGSPVGSYVARWKFDDMSGTTAQDTSSNDNDLSLSATSWTTNGKFTGAWNGTNAVWLSRADDADFDFAATEDFSVSGWFKSDSATNPAATEYLVNKASSVIAGYAVYANTSGQICFGIDDDTAWDPDVASCSSTDYYDGAWHYVTAIRNVALDTNYLYIDGISRDSDTDTTTATLANSLSLYVGDRDGVDNGDEFAGDLDEVKIFRSALTADQIKLDMNQGSVQVLGSLSTDSSSNPSNSSDRSYCVPGDTGACSAPIAEWKFEEGSGTSANDTSSNGKTGTITGATFSAGKVGKSLNFNGDTDTVSSIGSISGIKTVGFWINPTSTTVNIIDINTTGPAYISASAGTISATGFTSPTIYVNGVVSSTLTANIWQFVTVTTDTGLLGSAIQLGRANGTSLTGKLDQVRLYDSAHTPAQIAWDYNRGSPVGWWKFDECQGGTLNDAAGNGLSGAWNGTGAGSQTAVGTCSTASTAWGNGVTGKFNSSLNFDGTDDYISLGDNSIWDFGTGDFAFSAWIKRAAQDAVSDTIISKDNNAAGARQFVFILQETNDLLRISYFKATDSEIYLDSSSTITDTNWHHVVGQRRGNSFDIYIDGKIDATGTTSGTHGSMQATVTEARIGNRPYSGFNDHFNGQIDDVRAYNYALTAIQIKSLYNNSATVRYGPSSGSP